MDSILQGIPNVLCYLDDILATGAADAEHISNLGNVLQRLQDHGIKAQNSKFVFLSESVEYLGHTIDGKGLHTSPKKVVAIQKARIKIISWIIELLREIHSQLSYSATPTKPITEI